MAANIKKAHLQLIEKAEAGKARALSENLNKLIKEEFKELMAEAEKRSKEISTKLEDLRKTMIKEGKITLALTGSGSPTRVGLPERRIPLQTVSEILDIPINELILHFLNGHRIHEGRQLVQYRLGCVYFYGMPKSYAEVE
jgi:hypothetical protein